jgi:hypothetical protein
MSLPGAAPWIKVKGISTGVPGTEINPLVLELTREVLPGAKWDWINSIMLVVFLKVGKYKKICFGKDRSAKSWGWNF